MTACSVPVSASRTRVEGAGTPNAMNRVWEPFPPSNRGQDARDTTPDGVITYLRRGGRVRLKPRAGGDLLDGALAGRVAVIDAIEEDDRATAHVAVFLEDDPGRDLAAAHHLAHRFFFAPEELEPLEEGTWTSVSRRVLVAGIGNIFLGDDGFGSAVAQRLATMELPQGMEVADFGIRGMDLAYALGQPYDAVILVDTVARGGYPGRLFVMEPDLEKDDAAPRDSHRMEPVAVLRLARRLGGLPPQIYLVGCEPMKAGEGDGMSTGLSAPVAAAVEQAARMVRELVDLLLAGRRPEADGNTETRTTRNKEP
jgi:hydrogenase maturation protease